MTITNHRWIQVEEPLKKSQNRLSIGLNSYYRKETERLLQNNTLWNSGNLLGDALDVPGYNGLGANSEESEIVNGVDFYMNPPYSLGRAIKFTHVCARSIRVHTDRGYTNMIPGIDTQYLIPILYLFSGDEVQKGLASRLGETVPNSIYVPVKRPLEYEGLPLEVKFFNKREMPLPKYIILGDAPKLKDYPYKSLNDFHRKMLLAKFPTTIFIEVNSNCEIPFALSTTAKNEVQGEKTYQLSAENYRGYYMYAALKVLDNLKLK